MQSTRQSRITNVSTPLSTTLPWLHQHHNRNNGDDHNHNHNLNHNGGGGNGDYGWEGYVGRARASDADMSLAVRYVVFLFSSYYICTNH